MKKSTTTLLFISIISFSLFTSIEPTHAIVPTLNSTSSPIIITATAPERYYSTSSSQSSSGNSIIISGDSTPDRYRSSSPSSSSYNYNNSAVVYPNNTWTSSSGLPLPDVIPVSDLEKYSPSVNIYPSGNSSSNIIISNPTNSTSSYYQQTNSVDISQNGYLFTNKSGNSTWINTPSSSEIMPLPDGASISDYSKYYNTNIISTSNQASSTLIQNSYNSTSVNNQLYTADISNNQKNWIDKYMRDAHNNTNISDYNNLTTNGALYGNTLLNCTAFTTTYVNNFGTHGDIFQGNGGEVVGIMVANGYQRVSSPQSNTVFSSDAQHTGVGHTGLITNVDYEKNEITIAQGAWQNADRTTVETISINDFNARYPDATFALVN